MVVDRAVDAMTAVSTSVRAAMDNPGVGGERGG
jgi:uncharacterized membrane protein